MGRRSHPRTEVTLRVQLWGTDANGHRFLEVAWTENLSEAGTQLKGLNAPVKLGELVGLTYGGKQAQFRVVWIGEAGTPYESHMGLVAASPTKPIWDFNLPPASPDQYVTPRCRDRRLHARFRCFISALLRPVGTQLPVWGQVTDISLGGCYVQTASPLPAGSKLGLDLLLNESRLHTQGEVRSSHPGLGMGINFVDMGPDQREQIEQFVKWFAGACLGSDPSSGLDVTTPVAPVEK